MDVCRLRYDDRPTRVADAATIALVRDGQAGIEVWMMRRVSAMSFASGALVSPGGGVDPRDADPDNYINNQAQS